MSYQPPPDDRPEPHSPAVTPDGTSAPAPGQPWSTPSGDFHTPEAYQPPPGPPTAEFPVTPPPPAGYGYGYAQPGYPPQPPPRKSNAPLIAVIVAVALLLCGGIATAGVMITRAATQKARDVVKPLTDPTFPTSRPELPTGVPDVPGLPTDLPTAVGARPVSVTYEVTGDGPVQIAYVEDLSTLLTQLKSVTLPWKVTKSIPTPTLVSVTAVRLASGSGTVSCRAVVDGKEVAKKSATGRFGTVSCNSFVLE